MYLTVALSHGFLSSSWYLKPGHALLPGLAEVKRIGRTTQCFLFLGLREDPLSLFLPFMSKQVTELHPKSEGKNIYSASFLRETAKSHHKGWRDIEGKTEGINII